MSAEDPQVKMIEFCDMTKLYYMSSQLNKVRVDLKPRF